MLQYFRAFEHTEGMIILMCVKKSYLLCILFVVVAVISLSGCSKKEVIENKNNTVIHNKENVKYYGGDVKVDTYNINGSTYVKLKDVSSLFQTPTTENSNNISIGDPTRASAVYYMPDLSAYPNLDEVIGVPPYEIISGGNEGVVFKFVTKNVPFEDMIKKIDQKLKSDGFTLAKSEQYTELTNGLNQFKQGKKENTYIKYKNGDKEVTPNAIQIIDGGFDKNRLPIIIVKMEGN